jgi:hypothetical protein
MVDIEHDHRQIQPVPLGTVEFIAQAILEIAAVVDTGEGIGDRQRAVPPPPA